jgi:hypothetical protein
MTDKSKKYEKLGNPLAKFNHFKKLSKLMHAGTKLIFWDEVFFYSNSVGRCVTLHKEDSIDGLKPTCKNAIGAIIAPDESRVIAIKLLRTSIYAADTSLFQYQLARKMSQTHPGVKWIRVPDNFSAHQVAKMYQPQDGHGYVLKNAKYNPAGNFCEVTFASKKYQFYFSKGDTDLFDDNGVKLRHYLLGEYFQ